MPTRNRAPWHSKFDVLSLQSHATQLRNIPCSCDLLQRPMSGSLNWAIVLLFNDGIEWIFRSPTVNNEFSPEACSELLESEVATMKYIRENSQIPIPEIYDYSSTKHNNIGVPYILMSKAPGCQLSAFEWKQLVNCGRGLPSHSCSSLTQAQREKVLNQMGTVASQLMHLRFEKLGSLFEVEGTYKVGKCLSPELIFQDRHTLEDDIPRGPFHSDLGYYEALLSAFEAHIEGLRLQHSVFFAPVPTIWEYETRSGVNSAVTRWRDYVSVGGKIDSTRNRLDYYTVKCLLEEMLPSLYRESSVSNGSPQGFPLLHQDLSTSNIFVDDDFNITCIIDWTFTSTVPIISLLSTPSLPHPRDRHDPTLDAAFREGFLSHHFPEEYEQFTHDIWDHARKAWLFTRLTLLDGLEDYHLFKQLYLLIRKPVEEISISKLFRQMEKTTTFLELSQKLASDDPPLSEVITSEQRYFSVSLEPAGSPEEEHAIRIERQAIARKVTMARDLSQDFVADGRLWRWIEKMRQDLASL